jgi:hypothetical protein
VGGGDGKVHSGGVGSGVSDALHDEREAASDETSAGLQLNNHALIIPPGTENFRVEVQGTLPNDATLLSLFPHMHLWGKRFEYDIVHDDMSVEILLRVNITFTGS